jgi:DNA-binding LytR/AlgR family response regulator
MKCLIVEDEPRAAEHLQHQIRQTGYDVEVLHCTGSVEESVEWLNGHKDEIGLIFMDIQLGDGSSFDIFDSVRLNTPVIFTTSYNQFAIKAFEVNSVAYLLKPVKLKLLEQALAKHRELYDHNTAAIHERISPLQPGYQKRFLVQSGNVLVPLTVDMIAYFRVHSGRHLLITTTDRQQFLIDHKLELLELRLDPALFFRANRQYMVNINAVKQVHLAEHGKVRIEMSPSAKEEIIVSKERASLFKSWLSG